MEITEVRVKLINGKNDKLRAFCSITFDNDFVIRDLKVIDGAKGPFVAMPSRKLMERCSKCGGKNHYRAKYCNDCGGQVGGGTPSRSEEDNTDLRGKLHVEIAHPINSRCREVLQREVLDRYDEEHQRSMLPGYQPSNSHNEEEFDDYFQEDRSTRDSPTASGAAATPAKPALDEPGLGGRSQPRGISDDASNRSNDAGDRRSTTDTAPVRPKSSDYRQANEPRRSHSEAEKDAPNDAVQPKGPFKDPEADESEPEDNFGAGIFS